MVQYCWNFGNITDISIAFTQWLKGESDILSLSFGDGIVALFEDGSWAWTQVPRQLANKLRGRQKTLAKPTYVCTAPGSRFYVQFADGNRKWNGHRSFTKALHDSVLRVEKVSFAPRGGWLILFTDGTISWNGLPESLHKLLMDKQKCGVKIKDISVSPGSHWYVSFSDGSWNARLPLLCSQALNSLIYEFTSRIHHVWLGKNDLFCIQYTFFVERTKEISLVERTKEIPPKEIFFSKPTIFPHFMRNSLMKVIIDLKLNTLNPNAFPPIRVIRSSNKWITLDNSRLFAFQSANIPYIRVFFIEDPYYSLKCYKSVKVLPCKCKECIWIEDGDFSECQCKENQVFENHNSSGVLFFTNTVSSLFPSSNIVQKEPKFTSNKCTPRTKCGHSAIPTTHEYSLFSGGLSFGNLAYSYDNCITS